MLQKKLKSSIDPAIGMEPVAKNKHSVDEVLVGKKSKKRKTERDRNDAHDADSGNLCDETIETGPKPSLAKKVRKSKSSEWCDPRTTITENDVEVGETNKQLKKKKNKPIEGLISGQTDADNQVFESKETGENATPAKKIKKPKPSSESNKSTKSNTVTATEGTEENESKKKKKQKRKKKKKKKNVAITPKDQDEMSERCSSYLKQWKENRSEWKFQKLHQIWLVHNMMDDSRVPDDIFPVFLEYISAAKGQTVKIIHENATKVIEEAENNEAEMDDPKLMRARNIIQAIVID